MFDGLVKDTSRDNEIATSATIVYHEVFKDHWKQIQLIFNKIELNDDDLDRFKYNIDQLIFLLVNNQSNESNNGKHLLEFIIDENIFNSIYLFMLNSHTKYKHELKLYQLNLYELVLSNLTNDDLSQLFVKAHIHKPLFGLLTCCAKHKASSNAIEKHMISILNQLCVCLSDNNELLNVLFDLNTQTNNTKSTNGSSSSSSRRLDCFALNSTSIDLNDSYASNKSDRDLSSKFLIFSLLIPYIHQDGHCGQQARDALLMIMQLTNRNNNLSKYIVENTDFCPVLATGLSALFSELPTKLNETYDNELIYLTRDHMNANLAQFINSLEFCNNVIQVSHQLISNQLLQYVHQGFLIPVLAPALYQNCLDEVTSATAYIDLCIRTISDKNLMKLFVKFILYTKIDDLFILDTLITRLNLNNKLGLVTLMLFYTLIDLNSEDVLFKLILSHLIPMQTKVIRPANAMKKMLSTSSKNAECFLIQSTIYTINSTNIISSIKRPIKGRLKEKEILDALEWYRLLYENESLVPTLDHLEQISFNFSDYLKDAKYGIYKCRKSCKTSWSCLYEAYSASTIEETIGIDADDFLLNLFTKSSDSDYESINKMNATLDEKSLNSLASTMKTSSMKRGHKKETSARATTENLDDIEMYLKQLENGKLPFGNKSREQKDFYVLSFDNELSSSNTSSNESSFISRSSSEISLNGGVGSEDDELTSIKNTLIQLIFSSQSSIDTYLNSGLNNFLGVLDRIHTKKSQKKNENVDKILESIMNMYQEVSFKSSSGTANQAKVTTLERTKSLEKLTNVHIESHVDDNFISDVGPFLSTLLNRLEKLLINPLQVNLLVTGLLSRLTYFPQPMLRSILLDSKSNLNRSLASLKRKIDSQTQAVQSNFTILYLQAKICLVKRLIDKKTYFNIDNQEILKSSKSQDNLKQRKNSRSFSDILKDIFLVSPKTRQGSSIEQTNDSFPMQKISPKQSPFEWYDLKTQQLAYGTVIYDEFLKELASICEEHCVQQF